MLAVRVLLWSQILAEGNGWIYAFVCAWCREHRKGKEEDKNTPLIHESVL